MNENISIQEQNIIINNRSKIVVTGIKSVDSFDDSLIVSTTVNDSILNIEGTNLSIKDVNLSKCQFEAGGNISGVFYETNSPVEHSFLRRVFSKQ